MLYDIVQWRVPKENSKKHLDFWRATLNYQKSQRKKFYYTRTIFLSLTDQEKPSEETWMHITEYASRQDYNRMYKALREDPELAERVKQWQLRWDSLMVPTSRIAGVWTGRLRVD